MNISSSYTQINNPFKPSFGCQRFLKLNIPNGQYYFAKLDSNDIQLMEKALPAYLNTTYGRDLIKHYINNCKNTNKSTNKPEFFIFYNAKESSSNRIKAIAQIQTTNNHLGLSYLQSINETINPQQLKGAGSMLLYGLIKYAQEIKKKAIYLIPTYEEWYAKFGFTQTEWVDQYVLHEKDFPKALNYVEQKYNLIPKKIKA